MVCESLIDEPLIERVSEPRPVFSLMKDMIVERGTKEDWELLHNLHYKAENLPIGPRFWKLTLYGETIGVLVMGAPKGLLKERHLAFPKLKPSGQDTKISNTQRYLFVNSNFRVISRFVVDTMYRGIGAGYRMMNIASRMEGKRFIEIQSSMSKFNMFGQKAGFNFVKPMNANKYDAGMKFFRMHFASSPQDYESMVEEMRLMSPAQYKKTLEACREFYYRHSALEKTGNNRDKGKERVAAMDDKSVIKAIQQMTLASPLYGVWENPDRGEKLPDKIPLLAFECQGPREKLKWR